MGPICNLAGYRFTALDDPAAFAAVLRERAESLGLRGTCIVAQEGINFSLAGPAEAAQAFGAWLLADARFAGMPIKRSASRDVPFRRLRVKVKREIIRMGQPAIRPGEGRASAIEPATLRRWLAAGHDDEGRPLALLDARNAFEIEHGAFEGAIDWKLAKFGDFPAALDAHAGELAGKTVVTYCTGGIRCEKAALLLQQRGVARVHQLEGGILKYFEDAGGAHFRGTCFVFDARETLDEDLVATKSVANNP